MQRLIWNRILPRDHSSSVSWARKARGETFPLHDHDFPEVFWISEGQMRHLINGQNEALSAGDLQFIRAEDAHFFEGEAPRGGVIANVAVRQDVAADLRRRYLSSVSGAWWQTGPMPARVRLSSAELRSLDMAARELVAAGEDATATTRFVLNLFHLLDRHNAPEKRQSEPAWLADARVAMATPRNLAQGVSRLVQLSSRSPEHLARTVRQVHGITPTELVNDMRLRWASEQLQFSAEPIAGIALDAGFESLSHFYRLFKREFGMSPRRCRLRARSTV